MLLDHLVITVLACMSLLLIVTLKHKKCRLNAFMIAAISGACKMSHGEELQPHSYSYILYNRKLQMVLCRSL